MDKNGFLPNLKFTYRDLQAFTETLGEDELRSRQNYFRWLEYPLALSLLDPRPFERVLDVGSGYVNIMPLFMAAKLLVEVTAVDREEMPEGAAHHIQNLALRAGIPQGRLRVMQADAARLPFGDGSFDLVLCVSTLEHAPLTEDSMIAREIGRVLAPGGRAVFSFPFSHGEHVEVEAWGGEEYSQRHYNEYTARWRVVHPSGLAFRSATVFGESELLAGRPYQSMDREAQVSFCLKTASEWEKYWKIYLHVGGREEFYFNAGEIPIEAARIAGLIGLVLEKREEKPRDAFFKFDPFEFYLQNGRVCKTEANSDGGLTIERVRLMNGRLDDMNVFESGMNCLVEIRFTVRGDIEEPVFRLAFHDRKGNPVVILNTHHAGFRFGRVKGTHTLLVTFGMLNLLPGAYDLTVGAWEFDAPNPVPPYPFDVHYRKYAITMKGRMPGLFGVAYTPYELKLD